MTPAARQRPGVWPTYSPDNEADVPDSTRSRRVATAKGAPHAYVGVPLWQYRDALFTAVELPQMTRFVLLTLSQWMDSETGGNAFPGWERLQAATGLGRSTVAGHLAAGRKAGYLAHDLDSGRGGLAACYQAAIPTYRYDQDSERLLHAGYERALAKIQQNDAA
jgi:hypothetical protein